MISWRIIKILLDLAYLGWRCFAPPRIVRRKILVGPY